MIPSRIIANRFTIGDLEKDLLGRGGMGEVYRAIDTQTRESVAVKALNPEIVSRDPTLLERCAPRGREATCPSRAELRCCTEVS